MPCAANTPLDSHPSAVGSSMSPAVNSPAVSALGTSHASHPHPHTRRCRRARATASRHGQDRSHKLKLSARYNFHVRKVDIAQQKFGRLFVLRRVENRGGHTAWLCKCACGETTIARTSDLRCGRTLSCGCLRNERNQERTKHGRSDSPEFQAWHRAKRRCTDPRVSTYRHYGGRGIRMCERWLNDFAAFYEDMGPRPDGHTLDRIDVNGNYEPGNCRWATWTQQTNNMRRNVILTVRGEKLTMSQAARKYGLKRDLVKSRLYRGWTPEQALGL
jgi:hypothetical protein